MSSSHAVFETHRALHGVHAMYTVIMTITGGLMTRGMIHGTRRWYGCGVNVQRANLGDSIVPLGVPPHIDRCWLECCSAIQKLLYIAHRALTRKLYKLRRNVLLSLIGEQNIEGETCMRTLYA